jgi:GntR family transcriptional regulator
MTSAARLELVRTAAPLYRDVITALERAISGGVWKPGDQIPTEAELESRFGTSRGTLRMAIGEVVRKGLLHRQAGRGTFVIGPSLKTLEHYFRYESLASDPHIVPRNQVLGRRLVAADARVAAALGVAPDDEVACLRRLRHHRDEPFLIVDSYFPMEVWRQIAGANLETDSLYDLLKDEFALYVVSAEEFLRADLAEAEEAALLHIGAGEALIRIERTTYTFERRPIEYRRAAGRADRFRYHVSFSSR